LNKDKYLIFPFFLHIT